MPYHAKFVRIAAATPLLLPDSSLLRALTHRKGCLSFDLHTQNHSSYAEYMF